jgi:hypothetical protein
VQAQACTASPRGRGIALHLPPAQESAHIATGRGRFGSSRACPENPAAPPAAPGIDGPDVTALLSRARGRGG